MDFKVLVFGDSTRFRLWSQSEVELSECSERAEENPEELEVRLETPEEALPFSWLLSLLLKSLNLSSTEFLFWAGAGGGDAYGEGCGARRTLGRPTVDARGLKWFCFLLDFIRFYFFLIVLGVIACNGEFCWSNYLGVVAVGCRFVF